MRYLIGALMLFMFAGVADAQVEHTVPADTDDGFAFQNGNKLLRRCQDEEVRATCTAYITGVVDLIGSLQVNKSIDDGKTFWKSHAICLPRKWTPTRSRMWS